MKTNIWLEFTWHCCRLSPSSWIFFSLSIWSNFFFTFLISFSTELTVMGSSLSSFFLSSCFLVVVLVVGVVEGLVCVMEGVVVDCWSTLSKRCMLSSTSSASSLILYKNNKWVKYHRKGKNENNLRVFVMPEIMMHLTCVH